MKDDRRSSNRPVIPRTSKRSLEDDPDYGKPTEDHILVPGKLPRSRQFFYQVKEPTRDCWSQHQSKQFINIKGEYWEVHNLGHLFIRKSGHKQIQW